MSDLIELGVLYFEFVNDPRILEVHVFVAENYTGTVTETEEVCHRDATDVRVNTETTCSQMAPSWFARDSIPFAQMWPDDHLWFQFMLSCTPFSGYFRFQDTDTIIAHHITTGIQMQAELCSRL